MVDLEVGDGGALSGVPVDDVVAAIDEALLVEADEGLADGDGEASSMVKYSRDQSTEAPRRFIWSSDGAAVLRLPLPDAVGEGCAAELLAGGAFGGELALDHHLGGDAGVVGAGDPERVSPRMRCQRARMSISVWLSMWPMCRRPVTLGGGRSMVKALRQRPGCRCGGRVEEVLAHPVGGPLLFDRRGIIGFREFVRSSVQRGAVRRRGVCGSSHLLNPSIACLPGVQRTETQPKLRLIQHGAATGVEGRAS